MGKASKGIIPFQKIDNKWKICLLNHQKKEKKRKGTEEDQLKHWGFPKGGEETYDRDTLETAIRELKEEADLRFIRLLSPLTLVEKYERFRKGSDCPCDEREITYFLAEVSGKGSFDGDEIVGLEWFGEQDLNKIDKNRPYDRLKDNLNKKYFTYQTTQDILNYIAGHLKYLDRCYST